MRKLLAGLGLAFVVGCSGQVVGPTSPGSGSPSGAVVNGLGEGTCAVAPCPCFGLHCPVHQGTGTTYTHALTSDSQLPPEEQLIEEQMERELDAERAALQQHP